MENFKVCCLIYEIRGLACPQQYTTVTILLHTVWVYGTGQKLLTFNSQIKFVILLTVNNTILIILDQRIIPKLIFFFILITSLVDIVIIS